MHLGEKEKYKINTYSTKDFKVGSSLNTDF